MLFVGAWLLGGCGSPADLVLGKAAFVLERREEFDALDLEYWELATHTFEKNYAWFGPNNARVDGGLLLLSVTAEPAPAVPEAGQLPKPFSAAELRTRDTFLYGRFRARARFAPGSGIVSSFFGFHDRYSTGAGVETENQIVIEGGNELEPQLHYSVAVPAPAVSLTANDRPDFAPSEAFHVFGYDWTPEAVRFFRDGEQRAVVNREAQALTQPQRLLMSAYPSREAWAGDFNPNSLPVAAAYDWIEIESYVTRPSP